VGDDMPLQVFSERFKALRKANNLTQKEFGTAIGIGRNTVTDIETCRRTPSPDTFIAAAKYFNVSLDYIWGLTDDPRILQTA